MLPLYHCEQYFIILNTTTIHHINHFTTNHVSKLYYLLSKLKRCWNQSSRRKCNRVPDIFWVRHTVGLLDIFGSKKMIFRENWAKLPNSGCFLQKNRFLVKISTQNMSNEPNMSNPKYVRNPITFSSTALISTTFELRKQIDRQF